MLAADYSGAYAWRCLDVPKLGGRLRARAVVGITAWEVVRSGWEKGLFINAPNEHAKILGACFLDALIHLVQLN